MGSFTAVHVWNEYIWAFIMVVTPLRKTLTASIYQTFTGQYMIDYGGICAGLVFSIIPVFLIYLSFQNQDHQRADARIGKMKRVLSVAR